MDISTDVVNYVLRYLEIEGEMRAGQRRFFRYYSAPSQLGMSPEMLKTTIEWMKEKKLVCLENQEYPRGTLIVVTMSRQGREQLNPVDEKGRLLKSVPDYEQMRMRTALTRRECAREEAEKARKTRALKKKGRFHADYPPPAPTEMGRRSPTTGPASPRHSP